MKTIKKISLAVAVMASLNTAAYAMQKQSQVQTSDDSVFGNPFTTKGFSKYTAAAVGAYVVADALRNISKDRGYAQSWADLGSSLPVISYAQPIFNRMVSYWHDDINFGDTFAGQKLAYTLTQARFIAKGFYEIFLNAAKVFSVGYTLNNFVRDDSMFKPLTAFFNFKNLARLWNSVFTKTEAAQQANVDAVFDPHNAQKLGEAAVRGLRTQKESFADVVLTNPNIRESLNNAYVAK